MDGALWPQQTVPNTRSSQASLHSSCVFGPRWGRRRQDGWTSTPKAAWERLLKQRPNVRIESIDPHRLRRLQRSLSRETVFPTQSASSEVARDRGKRSLAHCGRSWSGRGNKTAFAALDLRFLVRLRTPRGSLVRSARCPLAKARLTTAAVSHGLRRIAAGLWTF